MPVPAKRGGSGDRRRKSKGGAEIESMIIFSRKASKRRMSSQIQPSCLTFPYISVISSSHPP
jgi:hypothetical protein